MTLNSSTVSGNSVTASIRTPGGGIFNDAGTVTLNSSTVSGNSVHGGLVFGGGVFSSGGGLTLKNTIVAGNFETSPFQRSDCSLQGGAAITSQGYNLIGDDSNCEFTPETSDQVGTAESPIDAMLRPLANNGGPTETHALLPGSPAIDAGSCGGATLDQRGLTRPVDIPGVLDVEDGCDIGALEAQIGVTFDIEAGDVAALVDALVMVNSAIGLSTIVLAENGAYVLEDGELVVKGELSIGGSGATITRSNDQDTPEFRTLHVTPTGDLTLNGLTISNGLVNTVDGGGGIWNQGGALNINNSTVGENTALEGGGIFNDGALLR